MRRATRVALVACLSLASSMAWGAGRLDLDKGDAGSLNSFPVRVLPVLVRVDAKGRIREIDPAYRLSPGFDRVLKDNVEEMILGPALDKRGGRIASQFILNLVVETNLRDDGSYDASFRYASTQPVPSGRWGWEHIDGYRLALFDRSRIGQRREVPVPTGSNYHSPPAPGPSGSAIPVAMPSATHVNPPAPQPSDRGN